MWKAEVSEGLSLSLVVFPVLVSSLCVLITLPGPPKWLESRNMRGKIFKMALLLTFTSSKARPIIYTQKLKKLATVDVDNQVHSVNSGGLFIIRLSEGMLHFVTVYSPRFYIRGELLQ